jgi:myo-inositol-1(or 4)-monophosphatase
VLLTNLPYEGSWFAERDLAALAPLLHAFRGVRRLGSAALALAQVAAGRASAACELRTNPWDHAAGAALVRAAGGRFEGWDARGMSTPRLTEVSGYVAAGAGFPLEESALRHLIPAARIIESEGRNV